MDGTTIIVGAGHAGGTAAGLLRQYGVRGDIVLLGAEDDPPYQRPPLSKAWLKGEADADALTLRPRDFYAAAQIELRTGTRVARLDCAKGAVVLDDGETLAADRFILATGARPIALRAPGADLSGVLALRTTLDAEALKARLGPGRRAVIVGGGYIGLEVAASARALGGEATVLERAPRLLARSASPQIAEFYERYHRARGVRIELNAEVVGFEGDASGAVTGVRLGTGELVPCDVAIVGVGVHPDTTLAAAAGLACDRGVLVDEHAQTSHVGIYAIGDCTQRPSPIYGRLVCPESVPNALEQAKQAAAHIAGRPAPAPEVPWNWSDQYDLKLQVAGFAFDVDQVVVRGEPDQSSFAVFHLSKGRIRQVEAVNAGPEFMAGRQLIQRQAFVDPARLSDAAVSMKAVAT